MSVRSHALSSESVSRGPWGRLDASAVPAFGWLRSTRFRFWGQGLSPKKNKKKEVRKLASGMIPHSVRLHHLGRRARKSTEHCNESDTVVAALSCCVHMHSH